MDLAFLALGLVVCLGLALVARYLATGICADVPPTDPAAYATASPPECCYKADLARPETWDDCAWPACSCDRRRRLAKSLDEDKTNSEIEDTRIIREALAPAPPTSHVGETVDWATFHAMTGNVLNVDVAPDRAENLLVPDTQLERDKAAARQANIDAHIARAAYDWGVPERLLMGHAPMVDVTPAGDVKPYHPQCRCVAPSEPSPGFDVHAAFIGVPCEVAPLPTDDDLERAVATIVRERYGADTTARVVLG